MIVNIELTEAGRAHVAEITDLLFQYFEMLRDQPPQDWLYQEQAKVAELGFSLSRARLDGWLCLSNGAEVRPVSPQKICWSPHTLWRLLIQHLSNSSWVT